MGIYWPPNFNNLVTFVKEVSDICKNVIIMSDFNVDINTARIEVNKLDEF